MTLNKLYSSIAVKYKTEVIAYLAPVYFPAIGGGVVYLRLLSRFLVDKLGSQFYILTEKFPGSAALEHQGGVRILRKYPFRAGRDVKDIYSYILYFWQNVQFLYLPIWVRIKRVDIFMVHGSFLNNPTSLWVVLWLIHINAPKVKLIADLRDPKLPLHKVPSLRIFDQIISCSDNVTSRLTSDRVVHSKVREIPIIIDVTKPSIEVVNAVRRKYHLADLLYIFNGSGLSVEKGIERLIDLTIEVRSRGINVVLVVVGKRRTWSDRLDVAQRQGWFHYLGQVSHGDSLALSAGSWIDVNLSKVDSMPRHSLEALMSGAQVMLPKGIPEFDKTCSEFIGCDDEIENLASKVIRIAEGCCGRCAYDTKRHNPDAVVDKYISVFSE